jgi:hypothetical protein
MSFKSAGGNPTHRKKPASNTCTKIMAPRVMKLQFQRCPYGGSNPNQDVKANWWEVARRGSRKTRHKLLYLDGNSVQLTALALRGARTIGWTLRGVAED